AITACGESRRDRADRRGARHVHRQRDLAEVVAGTQDLPGPHDARGHREHAREDDVEAVAPVALSDDRPTGRDLLALHAPPQLHERLARKPGEELDPRELVVRGGRAGHRSLSLLFRPAAGDRSEFPPNRGCAEGPSSRCRAEPDECAGFLRTEEIIVASDASTNPSTASRRWRISVEDTERSSSLGDYFERLGLSPDVREPLAIEIETGLEESELEEFVGSW